MRRGRPTKASQRVAPASSYRCSVCRAECATVVQCERHIALQHQGQALINDDSGRDLTSTEVIVGYKKTLKILKTLKCLQCSKGFQSALGYKFHLEICGKSEEEITRECEICGKRLKVHSLPIHIKMIHREREVKDGSGKGEQEEDSTEDEAIASTSGVNESDLQALAEASSSGTTRKRVSALRALKQFASFDQEDDDDFLPNVPRKRKPSEDVDFEVRPEEVKELEKMEIEEDEANEEVEENDYDTEGEDGGGDVEMEELVEDSRESLPEVNRTLELVELDHLLIVLKSLIQRRLSGQGPSLEPNLPELPEDKVDGDRRYNCYHEKCPSKFNFRFDLENHYRRCYVGNFNFGCSRCPFKVKSISQTLIAHFFQKHQEEIPAAEYDRFYERLIKVRTDRRHRRNQGLQSSPNAVWVDLLSQYSSNHDKPCTFACHSSMPSLSHITVLQTEFEMSSFNSPYFKTTSSMAKGDNAVHWLRPLSSEVTSSGLGSFHTGQWVTAVAWCPLPLTSKPNSCEDFSKLVAKEAANRKQYLALATTSYDDFLNQNHSEEIYLQLWDLGLLDSSLEEATLQSPPKLALNARFESSQGDILELAWCPYGVTYQKPDVQHHSKDGSNEEDDYEDLLPRLGILAAAFEDGLVRLFTVPHPHTVKSSYDSRVLHALEPFMVLQHRYAGIYPICNSLSWSLSYPNSELLGGYHDGAICLWDLTELATCCEGPDHTHPDMETRRPVQLWHSSKHNSILSLRWINSYHFLAVTIDDCILFHQKYPGPHTNLHRASMAKVEVHPVWRSGALLLEQPYTKTLHSVFMKQFFPGQFTKNLSQLVSLTNRFRMNDLSLSPWMHLVAVGTENGETFVTKPIQRPERPSKRQEAILISHTKLAKIDNNHSSSNTLKDLLHQTLDLQYSNEDFLKDYLWLLDDTDVFVPSRLRPIREHNTKGQQLTKNDLYKPYAVTTCAWNPNLGAYTWLLTATRSGLCRIRHLPIADPRKTF